MSDVKPTDADREASVDAAFLLLELAEARSGVRPGGEQAVAAAFLSRMRDFAYAQGRADEREACAKVAADALAAWDANCNRPQKEHSGPSYAAAVGGASAARDILTAIRARAAQEGASDA